MLGWMRGVRRGYIMLESFTFWLSILALLGAYLCVSVELRWRREEAARRSREPHLPGKAFDVSAIAPQIRQVRQDPLRVLQARGHPNPYRTRLLAAARCIIGGLPFFGRRGQNMKSTITTPNSCWSGRADKRHQNVHLCIHMLPGSSLGSCQ